MSDFSFMVPSIASVDPLVALNSIYKAEKKSQKLEELRSINTVSLWKCSSSLQQKHPTQQMAQIAQVAVEHLEILLWLTKHWFLGGFKLPLSRKLGQSVGKYRRACKQASEYSCGRYLLLSTQMHVTSCRNLLVVEFWSSERKLETTYSLFIYACLPDRMALSFLCLFPPTLQHGWWWVRPTNASGCSRHEVPMW